MNFMKVISYTIVHYGKDYIDYALRSIQSNVYQSNVIHTSTPSHGHRTNIQPIETLEQIQSAVSIPVNWYQTQNIHQEGQQRDYCVDLCATQGADLILVQDYDEIWNEQMLNQALRYVWNENKARNWLINFTHLWKSFDWCCKDEGWPVRIIDLRHREGVGYIPREFGEIYHFGYAVTDETMRYKWEIHGHKGELRPGWLDNQWAAIPAVDCHPTNDKGFWNTESFDKTKLPPIMKSHPWYNVEIIR